MNLESLSYSYPLCSQIAFHLADAQLAIVEERCRQGGVGAAVGQHGGEVLDLSLIHI